MQAVSVKHSNQLTKGEARSVLGDLPRLGALIDALPFLAMEHRVLGAMVSDALEAINIYRCAVRSGSQVSELRLARYRREHDLAVSWFLNEYECPITFAQAWDAIAFCAPSLRIPLPVVIDAFCIRAPIAKRE